MIGAMQIFHIAEKARWQAAELAGSYAQSTLGRTLDEEGFIHASRADQVEDTLRRFYTGVTEPLVLLAIDTEKLTSPWREEQVGEDTFPHIHGPLNPSAVVEVRPLPAPRDESAPAAGGRRPSSLMHEFVSEIVFRIVAAVFVMALCFGGYYLGKALGGHGAGLAGLAAGALVGVVVAWWISRRRDTRLRRRASADQPA